jgi:hypothetical protein
LIDAELDELIAAAAIELPALLSYNKALGSEYDCVLQGANRDWDIKIAFPAQFPYCLPKARLLDQTLIGTLPHVNIEGTICLEESDSVLVDHTRPLDVVCLFLSQIVSLLERIKLGIYQDELLDEFEGYFLPNNKVNSFYYAQDKLEEIFLWRERRNKSIAPVFISESKETKNIKFSNIKNLGGVKRSGILHIPLDQGVLPPGNGEKIDSQYVIGLNQYIGENNKNILASSLKREKAQKVFFILLSLPRSSDERSQLLFRFEAPKPLKHPLLEFSDEWVITPYAVKRHNKEYLLERGGADKSLLDKKVAVVGCGSVGGEVAMMLAKSGIGELTLIDSDVLDADNIHRHRLGGSYLNFIPSTKTGNVISWKKVDAVKVSLERDLPYVTVNSKPDLFDKVLDDPDVINADVIVVAVGSPSTSLEINKALKSLGKHNVVFCWNEAAGCGGHSVVINLNELCLECLYEKDGIISAETALSLVEPGQEIAKNITGCAGVFTPFSYLDSCRTAEMAAQQTIEMLASNKHSVAVSWKGSNDHGLAVTDRYLSMPLKQEINLVKSDHCRVCHG